MNAIRALAAIVVLFGCAAAPAADAPTERVRPKEIGSRTVVVDFTVDADNKAVAIDVQSSEAAGLNGWAKAFVAGGDVGTDSPGVTKLVDGKYRAKIKFPIEGDGAPLPADIDLPRARFQPTPQYPVELANSDTTGGALLRVTFNKKGKITEVELVRASHKEFGPAAMEAVKKWEFAAPAKRTGTPIEITLFQLFTFELRGKLIASWEWQMSPEPALPEYTVRAGTSKKGESSEQK